METTYFTTKINCYCLENITLEADINHFKICNFYGWQSVSTPTITNAQQISDTKK